MMLRTKMLMTLNKIFRAPVHPFNLQNQGVKTYEQWQYEKGADTIQFYLARYTPEEMFLGKTVVDIGCGAAGKSLYYASCGADKVIGVDIVEEYKAKAEKFAQSLGLQDRFEFVYADAAHLPIDSGSVDTVIMNDAMEHVAEPKKVIEEVLRILKKGGRAYINFPPYYHPYGAHLSDAVYMPWVHMFFGEKVLVEAYKQLVSGRPDADERIKFRIAKRENGEEYFSYINRMTIRRFLRILADLGITPAYYREVPLRGVLKPMCKLPGFREMFVKMVVCVIEK